MELLPEEQHEAAVTPPNSPPTGSRVEASQESYVAGFPDTPEPKWLLDAVARRQTEQKTTTE